jgi:predicted dehydrogenase
VAALIKIGFIGGGMMAQVGHLPFYLADQRVEVAAVVEERPSLREALSAKLGADLLLPSREALLARRDIDAVVISSPRPATGPLTLEALSAGKHVLAEKPMAHSVEQARRLVEAAHERKLVYVVGHMKLFDPGVVAAKAALDEIRASGRLGQLLGARVYGFSKSYAVPVPSHIRPCESRSERYPVWPTYPDWLKERYRPTYAWFLNSGSHDVSLLRHLLPGPVSIIGATSPNDGAVNTLLRVSDVPVHLEIAKTEAGHWLEGAEFLFEAGRLVLSIPSPMAATEVARVSIDDLHRGLVGETVKTDVGWCFARQARSFVDTLVAGSATVASGEAGLGDMELTEAIWRNIQG